MTVVPSGGSAAPASGFDPDLADVPLGRLSGLFAWLADAVRPAAAWSGRLPWWGQVLAIWGVGRLFSGYLAVLIGQYDESGRGPLNYLQVANTWDATYYKLIHDNGYPAVLPVDAAGNVVVNQWAFLPVYPWTVRAVTAVSGLSWEVAAPLVSTLASLTFLMLAYRLFRHREGHATSLLGVAILSFWTAAPVLQFDYAESLALLLLAGTLWFLVRGRYLAAIPVMVLAALTRPLAVPMALTCVLVAVLVVVGHRGQGRSVPATKAWSLALLVLAGLAQPWLWPQVAAWVTGVPDAYLRTEAAWHNNVSRTSVNSFAGSFLVYLGPVPGAVILVAVLLLVAAMMLSGRVRALGAVFWVWSGSFLGYLCLVLAIEPGWPRQVMPAFPLALALASVSRARAYRWLLLAMLAVTQVIWMFWLWRFGTWANWAP